MDEVKNVRGHISPNGNPEKKESNDKKSGAAGDRENSESDAKGPETEPEAVSGGKAVPGREPVTADQRIADLNGQLKEMQDKYLRLYAEFENFKKRNAKERVELILTAGEGIIRSSLPVIDDLERAIKAGEQSPDSQAIIEGLKLVLNKFNGILTSFGLQSMEFNDALFNPDFHEAVSNVPVEDKTLKGKIVDVVEKGYMLNGRVIRYAKVVVGA